MIIDYLKESLYDEDIGKLENYIKSLHIIHKRCH